MRAERLTDCWATSGQAVAKAGFLGTLSKAYPIQLNIESELKRTRGI